MFNTSRDMSSEINSDLINSISSKISGSSKAIRNYRDTYSKLPNTDIREGRNIIHAAEIFAGIFIAGFQQALKENQKQGHSSLVYANGFTGKTGYLASGAVARIVNNWNKITDYDEKLFLSCGVDLDSKPDFTKLFLGHIDAIFPQSRHATYSYANVMLHIGDLWGVSREKRLFIFGDYKTPSDALSLAGGSVEDILNLCDEDFAKFYDDAINNGYGLLDYRFNETPKEELQKVIESTKKIGLIDFDKNYVSNDTSNPQHQFLRHMAVQRRAVSHEIINNWNGPNLQGYSYGSRYLPGGHVAFCEAGTSIDKKMFMEKLRHGAAAANGKPNGGHGSLIAENGEMRFGGLTLSYPEMLANPKRRLFGFVSGSQKSTSLQASIEGEQSDLIPGSNMRPNEVNGSVIIGEASSMETTRYKEHPWDFKVIKKDDWNTDLIGKFFLNLSRDLNKSISEIRETDFLGEIKSVSKEIMTKRFTNLNELLRNGDWEVLKNSVLENIEKDLLASPDVYYEFLGIAPKGYEIDILTINPHPDDLTLAGQFKLNIFTEKGLKPLSIITCKGHTAVSDNYALGLTKQLANIPNNELMELDQEVKETGSFLAVEEKLLKELIEVLAEPDHWINDDPSEYNVWKKLDEREKILRAKLVYLRLQNEGVFVSQVDKKLLKGRLSEAGAINELLNVLDLYQKAKEEFNGTKDLKVTEEIKTLIRLTTEQTEQMSRGVEHSGIQKQWEADWYGGVDKHDTFGRVDIDRIKALLLENKPSMLMVNGEGFMDHEAHSITEMVTKIAVKELIDSEELNWKMQIEYYQGVWKGAKIKANGRQVLIPISEAILKDNDLSFRRNYPDQSPANVADPSEEKLVFFPDRVRQNFISAKNDFEATTGKKINSVGLAVYDRIDLSIDEHTEVFMSNVEEIQESADLVARRIREYSLPNIIGKGAPYANLSEQAKKIELKILTLLDVMTEDEFKLVLGKKRKSTFEN